MSTTLELTTELRARVGGPVFVAGDARGRRVSDPSWVIKLAEEPVDRRLAAARKRTPPSDCRNRASIRRISATGAPMSDDHRSVLRPFDSETIDRRGRRSDRCDRPEHIPAYLTYIERTFDIMSSTGRPRAFHEVIHMDRALSACHRTAAPHVVPSGRRGPPYVVVPILTCPDGQRTVERLRHATDGRGRGPGRGREGTVVTEEQG